MTKKDEPLCGVARPCGRGVGPVLGQMWIEPRPEEGPPSPPLRAPDPKVNTLAVFYGPMSTSKAVVP
jgi:hypothetical protein